MNDPWIDRISDYVETDPDEQMTPADARAFEAHLVGCSECRDALADIRAVIALAGGAGGLEPARDLWPGIAAQLDPAPQKAFGWHQRRWSLSIMQLAAAAVFVMGISGALVWLALDRHRPVDQAVLTPLPPTIVPAATVDPQYDAAVRELQAALDSQRARLDPDTIRVIELNLALIDRAVADAQQALAADPANVYLHGHLAAARHKKLALLRRATAIADREG